MSLALQRGECHVWWASPADWRPELEALLEDPERSRLGTFRRRRDRERFVVGAALARTMVADYAGVAHVEIGLDRTCAECGGPHGKPRVVGCRAAPQLSVSHSGDRVVVALALGKPVGVDVEGDLLVPEPVLECLNGVLRPEEARRLRALDPHERPTGFMTYWTRKESLVKAGGEGLRVPLDSFAVSGPDEPARVLACPARPHLARRATLTDLRPGPGYRACLAVLGDVTRVVETGASDRLASVGKSSYRGIRPAPGAVS